MAADTWELERDLGLARVARNAPEIQRLENAIVLFQSRCQHVENPEIEGRCYKCGKTNLATITKPAVIADLITDMSNPKP